MAGFNSQAFTEYFITFTTIPSGSLAESNARYTLISYAKSGEEHGEWTAKTALRILGGESPGDIPIVRNKKAKIVLNMRLAKKLGIVFPIELIEMATFVEEK